MITTNAKPIVPLFDKDNNPANEAKLKTLPAPEADTMELVKAATRSQTEQPSKVRTVVLVDGLSVVPTQPVPVDDGSVGDFIWSYADYADVLEAPRILHELVAIQLVATALNKAGVTIPHGELTLTLDMWIVLLTGSGGGRSTLVKLYKRILQTAQMKDLQSSVRWGSGPALFQYFSRTQCGLHVWGEMSEQLAMLNTPGFATAKQWITDRYDDLEIPKPFEFKQNNKPEDTKPIVFPHAPRINILATSSNEWFFRNLSETDSLGGFLARWIIYQADGSGRDVAIPPPTNISAIEPLAGRLAAIGRLRGQADMSAVAGPYTDWYSVTKRRFEAQPNRALATVFWCRHRVNILKLAVVFEASRSASLKVSVDAWQRAVEFAAQVEGCVFRLLPTGLSAIGYEFSRIEERIKEAGPEGVSSTVLRRAFQGNKQYRDQRDEYLGLLEEENKIFLVTVPGKGGKGRPAVHFVHKKHSVKAGA